MRRIIALMILFGAVLGVVPPAPTSAQTSERCFAETGFCISGAIRQYWERNGGLPVFGYPITPLRNETVESWTGPVQWFERDRLEDHSAEGQGVLAGRLGAERLVQLGRPWKFGSEPLKPGCRFFPETGYNLCGEFRNYWERNGGLARFGFPITPEINETIQGGSYLVQYFERRRMELHPQNRPPFNVLLGLLGSEVLTSRTPPQQPQPAQQIFIDAPQNDATIANPVTVSGRTAIFPASGKLNYRILAAGGAQLAVGSFNVNGQPGQPGSFSSAITFDIAAAGGQIQIDIFDINPANNTVIATASVRLRVQATTQVITIDEPRPNAEVRSPVNVTGRTTLFPASGGNLTYRLIAANGNQIGSGPFLVEGRAGQPARFAISIPFDENATGGQMTIEILDINPANNAVIARTSVRVGVPRAQGIQSIVIDSPAPGSQTTSPFIINGRTTRFPTNGILNYTVYAQNNSVIGEGSFGVNASGSGATFTLSVSYQPGYRGNFRVDIFERGANNVVVASTSLTLVAI